MKKLIITAALLSAISGSAMAESSAKPCTTQPQDKWMTLEAIEKIVKDHGYEVGKSKMKGSCAEVYAKDTDGKRIEFFIDPVTGNPLGTEWKAPSKTDKAS